MTTNTEAFWGGDAAAGALVLPSIAQVSLGEAYDGSPRSSAQHATFCGACGRKFENHTSLCSQCGAPRMKQVPPLRQVALFPRKKTIIGKRKASSEPSYMRGTWAQPSASLELGTPRQRRAIAAGASDPAFCKSLPNHRYTFTPGDVPSYAQGTFATAAAPSCGSGRKGVKRAEALPAARTPRARSVPHAHVYTWLDNDVPRFAAQSTWAQSAVPNALDHKMKKMDTPDTIDEEEPRRPTAPRRGARLPRHIPHAPPSPLAPSPSPPRRRPTSSPTARRRASTSASHASNTRSPPTPPPRPRPPSAESASLRSSYDLFDFSGKAGGSPLPHADVGGGPGMTQSGRGSDTDSLQAEPRHLARSSSTASEQQVGHFGNSAAMMEVGQQERLVELARLLEEAQQRQSELEAELALVKRAPLQSGRKQRRGSFLALHATGRKEVTVLAKSVLLRELEGYTFGDWPGLRWETRVAVIQLVEAEMRGDDDGVT